MPALPSLEKHNVVLADVVFEELGQSTSEKFFRCDFVK